MEEHSKANLDYLFCSLEPIVAVYDDPELAYLIHSGPRGVSLVCASLVLQPISRDRPDRVVEAANFYGFSGRLKSLGVAPRLVVEMLLNARVPAPDETKSLTPNELGAGPHVFRHPHGENSVDNQHKIFELMASGLSTPYWRNEDDNWALRAANTPYSDVNDLLLDLGLPINSHYQLHIVAFPPLVVDPSSRVRGEIASLKLFRSKHLPVEKTAMGVVVRGTNAVTQRAQICGEKFTWVQSEHSQDVLLGTFEMPVEKASVIHCFAVYDNDCFHRYWVGDPDASQNPLREIYELFDPRFENAIEMLSQASSRGSSSAQEGAVAALLWVLGFAPLQIGGFSEAPDVIAVSQDGNVIVVECTLSDLQTKRHNKPQKLLDRTNDIRVALERSNSGDRVCIPVMVTSRKREDIKADIDDCERRGIVVYTQDDIEPLVMSTINVPRSELRFAEVSQRLEEAISRVKNEEREKREIARDVKEMKSSLAAAKRARND